MSDSVFPYRLSTGSVPASRARHTLNPCPFGQVASFIGYFQLANQMVAGVGFEPTAFAL